jgi:hypothetical protein
LASGDDNWNTTVFQGSAVLDLRAIGCSSPSRRVRLGLFADGLLLLDQRRLLIAAPPLQAGRVFPFGLFSRKTMVQMPEFLRELAALQAGKRHP